MDSGCMCGHPHPPAVTVCYKHKLLEAPQLDCKHCTTASSIMTTLETC